MFVAGIDAHSRYLVIAVVDSTGTRVLKPTRVRCDQPQRLLDVLAPYRPLEAVVETSSAWPWLAERLTGAGVAFVLAHARRLRAIAEARYKRDAIDAELLARMRVAGLIPPVYVTPGAQQAWATLVRHRQVLVAQRTACVNRIHGQLHRRGLYCARGHLLTRAGRQWLRHTAWAALDVEQRALVRSHLRVIAGLRPLVQALERRIEQVAGRIPEARLLMTIPGIGPVRALMVCAEALPIQRFPTAGHLTSYAGLVPTSKQSGERPVRHGAIPGGANRWLRGALVRAVVSHVQLAPASWLTEYYQTQKARLGWPVARVAAARKLARAMHAMLRRQQPWSSTQYTQAPQSAPSSGELDQPHAASPAYVASTA